MRRPRARAPLLLCALVAGTERARRLARWQDRALVPPCWMWSPSTRLPRALDRMHAPRRLGLEQFEASGVSPLVPADGVPANCDMVEIDYDLQRCKNGTAAVISVPSASDSSPQPPARKTRPVMFRGRRVEAITVDRQSGQIFAVEETSYDLSDSYYGNVGGFSKDLHSKLSDQLLDCSSVAA